MPSAHHYRRCDIPQVVFAFVEFKFTFRNAGRQRYIAFNAVLTRFGMDTMEFRTDILPADTDQDPAFEINNAHWNARQIIKIVHKGLY
ncbi:MAG: hypothetical protein A4E66_01696 [Syntrophus sp. PtaB.Bin001]|nr:MAG: hypothetical protein A4E66_01696 [Syntrophus sp. PtaB.Bin001]